MPITELEAPAACEPTLADLLLSRITLIWVLLIAVTAVSWYVGTDHGIRSRVGVSIFVLCIAFFKVRLVGLYFMEIRHAPIVLRILFAGYCAGFLALVVAMYVVA